MRIPMALACLALLSSCSSSGGSSGGGTTAFAGILSSIDGTTTGAISFSIATASPSAPAPTAPALVQATVTGTLKFDGASAIALSGSYETTTGDISVSGGGYTLTGVFDGIDKLEGSFTGPAGDSGGFVMTKTTTADPATTYCGTFQRDDQQDYGTFSLVIRGTSALGRWASGVDGQTGGLEGTVSGTSVSFNVLPTGSGTAVGSRSGTTLSGTFISSDNGTGTWQGAVCQ